MTTGLKKPPNTSNQNDISLKASNNLVGIGADSSAKQTEAGAGASKLGSTQGHI